jgi:hypothetical protein
MTAVLVFAIFSNLLLLSASSPAQAKSIGRVNEPRIFFGQLADATGFFPIEINVPDTISSMMSGLGSMYESVSGYFGGGQGEESESESTQPEAAAVLHDEVNVNVHSDTANRGSVPLPSKNKKKKKVTRGNAQFVESDDYADLFNYFIML